MKKNKLGDRFLACYYQIQDTFLPFHTRRRLVFEWLTKKVKAVFGLKADDVLGEQIILKCRRYKDGFLYLVIGRRAARESSLLSKIYFKPFDNNKEVYLRLCSAGMGDVIDIVPLIHSIIKEYPDCIIITNHWRLPFQYIAENCVSVPDKICHFAQNVNFYDFSDRVNYHFHCPTWMQYFLLLDRKPTTFSEDPFPLLPDNEAVKLKLDGKPYVVFHTRSERSEWQGRQTHSANIIKVIEHLRRQRINIVEIGNNIPLIHSNSISFLNNTSFHDLLFIIKHSIGFVGIDSFPMHVASLYRKPILGFFGATQPLSVLPTIVPVIRLVNDNLSCLGCVNEIRPDGINTCFIGRPLCEELCFNTTSFEEALSRFDKWILDKQYYDNLLIDCGSFYLEIIYRMARRDFYISSLINIIAKDHSESSLEVYHDLCYINSEEFILRLDKVSKYLINYTELAKYLNEINRDKILISYNGGIGDTLILYWLANALKRQFHHAYLFVIPSDRNAMELKNIIRFMVDVFVLHMDAQYLQQFIKENDKLFNLIFDCRYVTKVIATSDKYEEFASSLTPAFDKYNINFDKFPLDNYLQGTHNLSIIDKIKETSGIKLENFDISYPLAPDDFTNVNQFDKTPYVTISTGVDKNLSKKKSKHRKTKQWPLNYWRTLINNITSLGIEVIHLGTTQDEPIKRTINLLGKTTVGEAGAIIKYALCHISVEGGLVWLAKAVGTKSIVLFGPTDKGFFGQSENINLSAELPCSPCWWKTETWTDACPLGYKNSKCMEAITPEVVFEEVKIIITDYKRDSSFEFVTDDITFFSKDLVANNCCLLNELCDTAGISCDQVYKNVQNDLTGVYLHGSKYWEYLYALKHLFNHLPSASDNIKIIDVGAGRGAIHKLLLHRGYDVTIADINFAHLGEQWESKFLRQCPLSLKIAFNSIFNLSFPSESFDVVLCFSVIEHVKEKVFALKELLRVLKDGGILILTFDFTSQKAWAEDINDIFGKQYRVEVFNEENLVDLLENLGIHGDYSKERLLRQYSYAINHLQECPVEGIPPGLTFGGLVISKQLKLEAD
jgi:ADP-heptose:LPS heptosyltransferase/ubiquinone/menaquinone biosynthesis C-methylase UbiE